MARLGRADDQRSYSLRRLRRIDRHLEETLAEKASTGDGGTPPALTLRIPVHAHVILGDRSQGPSRKAVLQQIAILNDAFRGGQSRFSAGAKFRFYLESFDRTQNQRWYTAVMFDDADQELRRKLHKGGPDALNLYFSAPRGPFAGAVFLGWSSVPWMAARRPLLDGVTIHEGSMSGGSLRGYNRGDTTVHEVGHWLGLFHTFEGGCSPRNDRVADTPAEFEPSTGCELGKDTCEASGLDPVHNFMDYSLDACMERFTPGQVARMTDNWLAYRTP